MRYILTYTHTQIYVYLKFINLCNQLFLLIRNFADSIQRPFGVRYNPYTQEVEVLSNAQKITAFVSELKGDLSLVCQAMRKISANDEQLDVDSIANMLQTTLNVRGDRTPGSSVSPDNSDNSLHSVGEQRSEEISESLGNDEMLEQGQIP